MSAPLFTVGFTFVWTLMLINFTNETFAIMLGFIALVSFFLFLNLKRDKTVLTVLLSCCFICALFVLKTELYQKPALSYVGKTVQIEGQIVKVEERSDSGANRYIIKVKEGDLKGYKIRLSSKYFEGELDDTVSFTGKIYEISYLKYRDIFLGSYTYDEICKTSCETFSFRKIAYNIRLSIEKELFTSLQSSEASVLLGMLIGDKSSLSDDTYELFQNVGIVHLLAVSGFHVSLWSMLLYRTLLKRGLNMKLSAAITIVFIVFFMGITGFARSTIRAGLMLIIFFVGRVLSRQPDSKNSLGISAILICVTNPFVLGDTGFVLSFFSTLGILILFPKLLEVLRPKLKQKIHNFYLRKRIDDLLSIVLITVSTFIFTLPLIMLLIGDMSLISPISNLLVTTVASAAIFLSGMAVVISELPVISAFKYPLFLVSGLIIKYVLWISSLLECIPFATFDMSVNFVKVSVSAVLVLIGAAMIVKARPKVIVATSSTFFVLSIFAHYLVEYIETIN